MKRDKAIIKALDKFEAPPLSADFNTQLMKKISEAAAQKEKRAFIVNICIISVVSLGLVAMAIYLLRDYITSDIAFRMPVFHIVSGPASHYLFFAYIAFLALLLLGLDYFFRHLREKKKDKYLKHSH
ncbi:MAG: hypothetical protein Q8909_18935 [Bacteroidota bacterium]|uniref:hypothetical protein n=1 Tax=Parabacteroides sp. FAFU027 TaxID=2922715 RepID=UPI001FAFE3AE|nr:hypothetical protein [Parabacteroides sp. FAFU027]MDP4272173.1 hypothetical protein [Bacteroidota bacterium]